MPKNVEIKAKVQDVQWLKGLAAKLSSEEGTILEQEDTFFNSPNGRLKLRVTKVINVSLTTEFPLGRK